MKKDPVGLPACYYYYYMDNNNKIGYHDDWKMMNVAAEVLLGKRENKKLDK